MLLHFHFIHPCSNDRGRGCSGPGNQARNNCWDLDIYGRYVVVHKHGSEWWWEVGGLGCGCRWCGFCGVIGTLRRDEVPRWP